MSLSAIYFVAERNPLATFYLEARSHLDIRDHQENETDGNKEENEQGK